jgi:hypothetical protein
MRKIILIVVGVIIAIFGILTLFPPLALDLWLSIVLIGVGIISIILGFIVKRKAKTSLSDITVQNTTAPVITLVGDNTINVNYADNYNEQGATWADTIDGSGNAVIGGDMVNTNTLGTYIVRYNYTDSAGNIAAEVTRTVNVVDITKPIITLNSEATMYIENGETYNEQGAVWNDNVDGTGSAIVSGDTVNINMLGTYIVRYNYTDSSGNEADEVTRTVSVVDTQKPTITLLGDSEVTLEVFSFYSDAGATAYDSYDGDLTPKIISSDSINTNLLGDYFVKYNVSDSSGNIADEVSRTVHVVDTTKPILAFKGINPANIYIGDFYSDDGATATDNVDGDITYKIQTVSNVDTAIVGTYAVTYKVSDSSGNEATETRTVNVIHRPPTAKDDGFAFVKNEAISIPIKTLLSNDSDPEGGQISFISISQGTGGKATYSNLLKRVAFKPVKDFMGLASFSYTIQNSNELQSNATVWLSIDINELPNKLPPIAVNKTLSTNKVWTSIPISSLLANESNPEGSTISFVSVGNASNNARVISLKMFGQLLLIVKRGYTGDITFPCTVRDSVGLQSSSTVTVNVNNAHY